VNSGRQGKLLLLAQRIQKRVVSNSTMSPTILTLPIHAPLGDFQRFFLTGGRIATGRPRLLALTTRDFIGLR
jgi:hypothetical protein